MEPINEYLDKVLHYLKEVSEKDELVTEGIRKLRNCEDRILKMRTESRDKLQELREQLERQKSIAKNKGFESEQLDEQLKRLTSLKKQNENDLRNYSEEINKNIKIATTNFKQDMETLRIRRDALLESKLSNISNRQD